MVRTICLAVGCVVLLGGSGAVWADAPKATKEKLVGTWVGNVTVSAEKLEKNPILKDTLPKEKVSAVALVFGVLASTKKQTLTFRADGTAVNELDQLGKTRRKQATWKVVEAKDDSITVELMHRGEKKKVRMTFVVKDDDHMELKLPGLATGVTHTFTRQKAKK